MAVQGIIAIPINPNTTDSLAHSPTHSLTHHEISKTNEQIALKFEAYLPLGS